MENQSAPSAIRDDVKFSPRTFLKKSPSESKPTGTSLVLVPEKMPEVRQFDSTDKYAGFRRNVTDYDLARLAQRINSKFTSWWHGSRKEKELCQKWNLHSS